MDRRDGLLALFGLLLIFGAEFYGDSAQVSRMRLGAALAIGVVVPSVLLRLLTPDGGIAAFVLGVCVFGTGGLTWAIPLILFFVTSSLLSKIGRRIKNQLDRGYEKTSRRDRGQVLANGGVAGLLALGGAISPHDVFYWMYLGTLAAVTADTWSTEIGTLWPTQPRLITTGQPVPPGTSGGVTLPGTLGGWLGAVGIAVSGVALADLPDGFYAVATLSVAGMGGNLLDSLAGQLWQAHYRCPTCQQRSERRFHCPDATGQLVSGRVWLNNDAVNILCALTGAGLAAMAYGIAM